MEQNQHIKNLQAEVNELKSRLIEAEEIIGAIRDGSVDALVVQKDGQPSIFSMESADYTYRILIEKFGEGALSISHDGLILYCNDAFSKLLAVPAGKIMGTYLKSYIGSGLDFDKLLSAACNDGPVKAEFLLMSADKKIPVYLSITDLEPNVSAMGVVVTDLSEKRRYEYALVKNKNELEAKVSELARTNVNLEQFIHVISHDLKEPVRKLATFTGHLTSDTSTLSAPQLNSLRIINSSALRLNSLVDDLVKYAFVANRTEDSEVDMNSVLLEVLEDLELLIAENNAIVDSDHLPTIRGSKIQMRQLFSNLLTNAMKYGKANIAPEINISAEIKTEGKEKFHVISFSDNGIGMDPAHFSRIFTIFRRLHLRDEYSGNGIGLAICKKVMENHNGKIDVESSPKGTTFILSFPFKH